MNKSVKDIREKEFDKYKERLLNSTLINYFPEDLKNEIINEIKNTCFGDVSMYHKILIREHILDSFLWGNSKSHYNWHEYYTRYAKVYSEYNINKSYSK